MARPPSVRIARAARRFRNGALGLLFAIAAAAPVAAQQHVLPRPAHAPEEGRMGFDGTYLSIGPSFAAALDRGPDAGFVFGGELSVVNVHEVRWLGAYLDAAYDFGAEEARLSFGPEVGIAIFGLDAGYVLAAGGAHGTQHGLALRPLLTIGFASAYFRSTWLFGEQADWHAELGVVLKLPIPVSNTPWF